MKKISNVDLLFLALLAPACASTSESAQRDPLTENVGVYYAPPAGILRPRIGVPRFKVTGEGGGASLDELAADQLTTLAFQSDRFEVIERAQLEQLLDEQDLEGIVKAGEMTHPAQVRGVDYLFLGKVTNLRIKAEKSSSGFGLAKIAGFGGGVGAFDFRRKDSKITAECGVDLRLVDPETGSLMAAHFGEFKRTDTIGAFGIEVLGFHAGADADLQIDEDNRGKILRLALDDALRKMLPRIDRELIAAAAKARASNSDASGEN